MYDTGLARRVGFPLALAALLLALPGCPSTSQPGNCPSGQTLCGGACVDTSTDLAHCGSCSLACASGQSCASGSCACPAKTSLCGSACVDLSGDVANCGACGHGCSQGQSCSSGRCTAPGTCAAPLLQCPAACVNPAVDSANCGACGHACAVDESCTGGACVPVCRATTTLCAGACVDTSSNAADCGSCGHACAAGQVCSSGACAATCTAPAVQCGSACVDLATDLANCGGCGQACAVDQTCASSQCVAYCRSGTAFCSGVCVNTAGDPANCGSCGHLCATGQSCVSSQCTSPQGPDAGASLCGACLSAADCPAAATCVQIGGEDSCAAQCQGQSDCTASQICLTTSALDGTQVQVCVPSIGSCNGPGCGTCPAGQSCDIPTGQCLPEQMGPDAGPASETCGTLVGPDVSSSCTSCQSGGSHSCQANGCYGGWWCDTATSRCQAAPTGCASSGPDAGGPQPGRDGGTATAPDAGAPVTGSVGPTGGSVSHLYFAVTGDTRPGNQDQTASYPTAIIQKIFGDVDAMSPRPEFFLATGDFMYASSSSSASAQLQLYVSAMQHYSGTVFPVMGNHECDGYTADNCSGKTTPNLSAYTSQLVAPLGLQQPYYTVPITVQGGTAKLIVVACNAWDSTQQSWLANALAQPTTYTIIARHEPSSTSNAPCVSQMDSLLSSAKYDLLLVGHTHTFSHSSKEVVVGIGGAPLTGGGDYGFATVEQLPQGFEIKQYDYQTMLVVQSFTVPY